MLYEWIAKSIKHSNQDVDIAKEVILEVLVVLVDCVEKVIATSDTIICIGNQGKSNS